jgi:3',5'-cyclic AMP phosphodiesterase CpdA/tetratricopeptide (TPR) repeat protein
MSASTTYTLRVLHLSDLHERVAPKTAGPARDRKVRAHKAKQARVLGDELMEQLDKIVAAGAVDLLFFTGDLADWGLVGEYDLAKTRLNEIIRRVGLTWAQVFFVPGNHDVNRNKESQHFAQLRRFAAENPDKIGAVMAGFANYLGAPEETLNVVTARQAGHHELLRQMKRESLIPGPDSAHPCLGYREQVQVRDLPFSVHIIGLDTAWLAGGDDDSGKLRLTDEQIDAHTRDDEGEPFKGLRLALMHHPLADLADHLSARRLLAGTVDLVTHGHQHVPGFVEITDPDRRLAVLAAGCLYEGDAGDRWANRFHVLNIETNDQGQPLRYRVEFFKWSTYGMFWVEDADLYKNSQRGLVWETRLGPSQLRPTVVAPPLPAAALAKFIGRTTQLAALSAALLPPSGQAQAAVVCNLQGMAGVGKSFLIDRFFADHSASFPGGHLKITLGHGAAPSADTLLSELAERLRLQPGPGDLAARVRSALADTRPLLHLDNLDTPALADAAAEVVERLPGVPLILTGRHTFDDGGGLRVIPVAPFEVPEALRQLDAELGEARAKAAKEADKRALVTELGGLPLAIALAGSYLRGGRSIPNFLSLYRERLLHLGPDRPNSKAYQDPTRKALRSLAATFSLSIDALRERLGDEAEAGLPALCALGVAPLSGVRIGWLAAIMGVAEAQAEDWLDKALGLSIVQHDPTSGRWRVHKLLAEHLRQHTDADAAIARMDAWVMERLPEAPDDTRGARWGALQAEHEAMAEWVAGLDGARAVAGGLRGYDYAYTSGPYAAWLGAVARGLVVSDDPGVRSDLLWRQGNLARQAGDLELANRAAEAKGAHDAARGEDREVALAAGLRADIHEARGQLDEALRIRRDEVLPVVERLGDVRAKAVTMSQIADILQARGQLDEALRIHRGEVLPVVERLGDVREKAVTMGKIADILQARGQLDEALRIRRDEVLPVYERLGDVYSKAVTMGKIADILQARGQLDEALRIRRDEELPVFERLGDVRSKAVTMGKIADILQARGQLDEALRIYRDEVLPVYEQLGDRRSLLVGQTNLAITLLRTRKPEHRPEALTLLSTALKSAVDLNFPVQAEQIRGVFRHFGLPPPY